MLKKIASTLLVLIILTTMFGGCKEKEIYIGYDISLNTTNIDPQFYNDKTAEMVIVNTFEGLVIKDSKGDIHPGVAKSWQVSSDGLEYTFDLRADSYWPKTDDDKKLAVTAHDFVFTFQRILNSDAPSLYSNDYINIKNGEEILNGKIDASKLGVTAKDDKTLVIRMERPDSNFLLKLSKPAASPCNKEFFNSTRGRYGLDKSLILGNGPYSLTRWEDNRLTLSKNIDYRTSGAAMAESVDLYVDREERGKRFKEGKTDIIKISPSQLKNYRSSKYTISEFDDTLWCLAFNMQSGYFSSEKFRSATAYSLDKTKLDIDDKSPFKVTDTIFSASTGIDSNITHEYSPTKAQENYKEGLAEADIRQIPVANIYIPEGEHKAALAPVQEGWKNDINLYYSFTEVPITDLDVKIRAKDFDMALLPIAASATTPEQVLGHFVSDSKQNYVNYENSSYDYAYKKVTLATDTEQHAQAAIVAEEKLFSDVVVIPLYIEKGYYVLTQAADVDIYFGDNIIRFYKTENEALQNNQ